MAVSNGSVVAAGGVTVAAVAAVLGGAFFPGPRIAVGMLLVLWLVWWAVSTRTWSLTGDEWALLALVAWGGVSVTLAWLAPLAGRQTVAGWLAAWCLWAASRRAEERGRQLGSAIVVAASLMVVAGLVLEALGRRQIRVGGLFENPNVAAALLVAAIPVAWHARTKTVSAWRTAVVVLLIGGVVVTGSRAGMLAVLAAGVVLLPAGRPRTVGMATGVVAALAVLGWRVFAQPEALAWFRPAIWLGVLRLWASRPLAGVGPGGLPDAAGAVRLLHSDHVGQRQFLITSAESTPLGLLVQVGMIGLAIATVALVVWARKAHARDAQDIAPLRSAVAGIAVVAVFHDVLAIDVVLWWWAVAIGLLEPVDDQHHATDRSSPWPRFLAAAALAFVVLWGIVTPAWARWLWRSQPRSATLVDDVQLAEQWFAPPLEWRARALLAESRWTWPVAAEALARSRQAVRVHPGASSSWMTHGLVNFRIINELGAWPGSVTRARTAFARAAELEPYQPWPWLEWARLERTVGDDQRAAALARRAIDAEPHTVRAWLLLARIELDSGQLTRARRAVDEARASASLAARPGLTRYERELLAAPEWQFRELEEALP